MIKETRKSWLKNTVKPILGKIINVAIEIGVWRGDFTHTINTVLKPSRTIGIDPYLLYEGYSDKPDAYEDNNSDSVEYANQKNLDSLYNLVKKRSLEESWELIREKSLNAVNDWEDKSVDFVYLDANHKYEQVLEDIEAWWPKIKPGGILSGHDFLKGSKVEKYGVIEAVTDFREKHRLTLNTTPEKWATWWVVKNKTYLL